MGTITMDTYFWKEISFEEEVGKEEAGRKDGLGTANYFGSNLLAMCSGQGNGAGNDVCSIHGILNDSGDLAGVEVCSFLEAFPTQSNDLDIPARNITGLLRHFDDHNQKRTSQGAFTYCIQENLVRLSSKGDKSGTSCALQVIPTPLGLTARSMVYNSTKIAADAVCSLQSSSMAIAMSFLHTSEGKQMLQSNLGHARIILLELGEEFCSSSIIEIDSIVKNNCPAVISITQADLEDAQPLSEESLSLGMDETKEANEASINYIQQLNPEKALPTSNGYHFVSKKVVQENVDAFGEQQVASIFPLQRLTLRIKASEGDMQFGFREMDEVMLQDWLAALYHLARKMRGNSRATSVGTTVIQSTGSVNGLLGSRLTPFALSNNYIAQPGQNVPNVTLTATNEPQASNAHLQRTMSDGERSEGTLTSTSSIVPTEVFPLNSLTSTVTEEEEYINVVEGYRWWMKLSTTNRAWCLKAMSCFRMFTNPTVNAATAAKPATKNSWQELKQDLFSQLQRAETLDEKVQLLHEFLFEQCDPILSALTGWVSSQSLALFRQLITQYGHDVIRLDVHVKGSQGQPATKRVLIIDSNQEMVMNVVDETRSNDSGSAANTMYYDNYHRSSWKSHIVQLIKGVLGRFDTKGLKKDHEHDFDALLLWQEVTASETVGGQHHLQEIIRDEILESIKIRSSFVVQQSQPQESNPSKLNQARTPTKMITNPSGVSVNGDHASQPHGGGVLMSLVEHVTADVVTSTFYRLPSIALVYGMQHLAGLMSRNLLPRSFDPTPDSLSDNNATLLTETLHTVEDISSSAWCGNLGFVLLFDYEDSEESEVEGDLVLSQPLSPRRPHIIHSEDVVWLNQLNTGSFGLGLDEEEEDDINSKPWKLKSKLAEVPARKKLREHNAFLLHFDLSTMAATPSSKDVVSSSAAAAAAAAAAIGSVDISSMPERTEVVGTATIINETEGSKPLTSPVTHQKNLSPTFQNASPSPSRTLPEQLRQPQRQRQRQRGILTVTRCRLETRDPLSIVHETTMNEAEDETNEGNIDDDRDGFTEEGRFYVRRAEASVLYSSSVSEASVEHVESYKIAIDEEAVTVAPQVNEIVSSMETATNQHQFAELERASAGYEAIIISGRDDHYGQSIYDSQLQQHDHHNNHNYWPPDSLARGRQSLLEISQLTASPAGHTPHGMAQKRMSPLQSNINGTQQANGAFNPATSREGRRLPGNFPNINPCTISDANDNGRRRTISSSSVSDPPRVNGRTLSSCSADSTLSMQSQQRKKVWKLALVRSVSSYSNYVDGDDEEDDEDEDKNGDNADNVAVRKNNRLLRSRNPQVIHENIHIVFAKNVSDLLSYPLSSEDGQNGGRQSFYQMVDLTIRNGLVCGLLDVTAVRPISSCQLRRTFKDLLPSRPVDATEPLASLSHSLDHSSDEQARSERDTLIGSHSEDSPVSVTKQQKTSRNSLLLLAIFFASVVFISTVTMAMAFWVILPVSQMVLRVGNAWGVPTTPIRFDVAKPTISPIAEDIHSYPRYEFPSQYTPIQSNSEPPLNHHTAHSSSSSSSSSTALVSVETDSSTDEGGSSTSSTTVKVFQHSFLRSLRRRLVEVLTGALQSVWSLLTSSSTVSSRSQSK